MTLAPGTRLGRFEIIAQLGTGGMGEVYRARDPNIDRHVAIKVLPHDFSTDPKRLQRFEQEARAAGRLNHPNILSIHDVALHDGLPFVVYELLEGETLRERLAGGPLSNRRIVDYALQIARGLAAAHAKGIVHRDLKPENIFITKDEHVKILDFGLAKLFENSNESEPQTDIPTRKVHTAPGTVMGTVGYMSPEQVRGAHADHRSDIFALGVVVYEMIYGERAFQGASNVEILNAILKEEPASLPSRSGIQPAIDRVVRRCLEKKPEERFQAASDVAFALEAVSDSSQSIAPLADEQLPARKWPKREYLLLGLSAVLFLTTLGLLFLWPRRTASNPQPAQFLVYPPENASFPGGDLPFPVAVSPDGQFIALVVNTGAQTQIWLRRLDALIPHPVAKTDGAQNPFWSPDGRFIGFFADGKLKKIAIAGGVPFVICDAPPNANSGTWNQENTILFTSGLLERGILRVNANGGVPVEVTTKDRSRDELVHFWPQFLPDGKHFLYLATSAHKENPFILYVASLESNEKKQVPNVSSRAIYSPPGYLLYVADGTLLAQPFDPNSLSFSGERLTIAEQVGNFSRTGNAYFSVSADGEVLAYATGGSKSRLVLLDEKGSEQAAIGEPNDYMLPRFSPDGNKLAIDVINPKDGTNDIWVYDLTRTTFTRFTFDQGMSNGSVWSPDGQRIVYSYDRDGPPHLFVKSFSDTNEGEVLLPPRGAGPEYALDWTPDGKFIIYREYGANTRNDLMVLPMVGDRTPRVFLQTPFAETEARFSPDGKWVAYSSDESGRREIYIRPFEGNAERLQISTNGGRAPRWTRDGKHLFYLAPDQKIVSVAIDLGASVEFGSPIPLFSISARNSEYDVLPDGKRILVNTNAGVAPRPLTVSTHWTSAVRR